MSMSPTTPQPRLSGGDAGLRTPVGDLLRRWRAIRRLSQLELSIAADVSQRHLSYLETGRSLPSREMVLHLADVLALPLRDRNSLLHAGGFAPAFADVAWDHPDLAPVHEAVAVLLASHEPYPAVVLDRRWSLVDANAAAGRLIATFGGSAAMAAGEGNAMRLLLHPDGLRRSTVNFDEVAGHLLDRIEREAAAHPADDELAALAEELAVLAADVPRAPADAALPMVVTSRLRADDGTEVNLISMLATLGGALEVTVSELVVELFYPADEASADVLRHMAAS